MRRFILTVLTIAGACNVWAQKQNPDRITQVIAPVNIASEESRKSFIPASDFSLKSGSVLKSDFQVEFVNFPENAKPAFLYAVSIYENLITSPVPIKVRANWESLGTNILAHSVPGSLYRNFSGARFTDVYYPVALAEKLSEKELNGSEADIECSFNNSTDWYYGTNGNCPSDEYDFVTIVLHELVHGLGFVGFFNVDGQIGEISSSNNSPSIYDIYIYNQINQQIADEDIITRPSVALKNELLSGNLYLDGVSDDSPKIYAPQSWNVGSSIYHFSESDYNNGTADALMTPYIFKGEAIHTPGEETLDVLASLGWKSVSFEGEINDFEEPVVNLPVSVEVGGELDINKSSVKITYSTDNFSTSKTVSLAYDAVTQNYKGDLPLNDAKGKINYYYHAKTQNNESFYYPERAPDQLLSFRVGTDYYPPVLKHNPEKMINAEYPELNVVAVATDNVGIQTVKVEYKINSQEQESFVLTKEAADSYAGKIQFPLNLSAEDVVEYRVVAIDNTLRENKRRMPTSGYYTVEVFEAEQKALSGYYSDFDSPNSDFEFSDFKIATPAGFSSGNLHTVSPYPESSLENNKYNLLAQLKHPIILVDNGIMTFDEVVLVEPGEDGTFYTEEQFWDFVIVEASKNSGKSWLPITDGYDSGIDELWNSQFTGSLKSAVSEATGQQNMFLKQTINLTDNTGFSAGDTVIFRFRLASDKEVTGWGWAIDNLAIQEVTTSADDMIAANDIAIYPNPFKNYIYVNGFQSEITTDVEIIITDLYGKTVYRETKYDATYTNSFKIDLPNVAPGVYMACITDNNSNTVNQKIIKN